MLGLGARNVWLLIAPLLFWFAYLMFTDQPGQCRITQINAVLFFQNLMNTLHPAITEIKDLCEQININGSLVLALFHLAFPLLVNDGANSLGINLKELGNFLCRVAFLVQKVDCLSFFRWQHETPPWPS